MKRNSEIVYVFSKEFWMTTVNNINSFWPIDAIWRLRTGSTSAQIMFVAWWHQSITWTSADWSSLGSFGIHLGISHEMLKGVSLKITDLTHWGRVTHICVSKLTIIGSENGLLPSRRQAIISTNAGLLSIGPLRTYFNEILVKGGLFD